jgi:hypothetical protein
LDVACALATDVFGFVPAALDVAPFTVSFEEGAFISVVAGTVFSEVATTLAGASFSVCGLELSLEPVFFALATLPTFPILILLIS